MDPRKARKQQTREALLAATKAILASGRSFDTLSLREVAKAGGIAPTSFYRHFHDIDELGFAIIQEHGNALVALIQDARNRASSEQSLIRASVESVYDFIAQNEGVCRMIVHESMSPESPFREASENLFLAMSSELAEYLEQEAGEHDVVVGYPRLAANAMISIMFTTGIALLNSPEFDRARNVDATVIKVKMILLGAQSLAAND